MYTPPNIYPPPIFIPPRLIARFAKICTPFSPAQGNTTRTNPGSNLNTTAMVTHLKKAVIVVCFLTFETLLEAWATAAEAQLRMTSDKDYAAPPPQNLYPPNIYTPLALLGVLPKCIPRGIHFGGGGFVIYEKSSSCEIVFLRQMRAIFFCGNSCKL